MSYVKNIYIFFLVFGITEGKENTAEKTNSEQTEPPSDHVPENQTEGPGTQVSTTQTEHPAAGSPVPAEQPERLDSNEPIVALNDSGVTLEGDLIILYY